MFTNDDPFASPFVSTNPYADPYDATGLAQSLPDGSDSPSPTFPRRRPSRPGDILGGDMQSTPRAARLDPRGARDPLFSLGQGMGKATGNFFNSLISGLGQRGRGARMFSDATGGAAGDGEPSPSTGLDSIPGFMSGGGLSTLVSAGLGAEFGQGGSGFGSGFGS